MLEGANIKKRKSSKSFMASGNSAMNDRTHREKEIEVDEKNLCAAYNSFVSCISFPLYLYGCPMLLQIRSFHHKQEKEEADKLFQKKNE